MVRKDKSCSKQGESILGEEIGSEERAVDHGTHVERMGAGESPSWYSDQAGRQCVEEYAQNLGDTSNATVLSYLMPVQSFLQERSQRADRTVP